MDAKTYKQQLLNELYKPYLKCVMCPLGTLGRTNVVFGEGNPDADLMFIGEAPGQEEDLQNRPFVGRSGKLLRKALDIVEIKQEEVFITNVVKCRPPGNRAPLPNESGICKNLFLFNQIKIIRPKIICTLGSIALQALIEESVQITKMRGKLISKDDMQIFPTYHPSYILRNPKEGKTFLSDIQTVKSLIYKSQ